jgi:hypothetical protein
VCPACNSQRESFFVLPAQARCLFAATVAAQDRAVGLWRFLQLMGRQMKDHVQVHSMISGL